MRAAHLPVLETPCSGKGSQVDKVKVKVTSNSLQHLGSLSLLQGIFPTQGSNPCLPHCRRILYQLSHKGRKIHGQRSLIGSHSLIGLHRTIEPYSPWGHKELDRTKQLSLSLYQPESPFQNKVFPGQVNGLLSF